MGQRKPVALKDMEQMCMGYMSRALIQEVRDYCRQRRIANHTFLTRALEALREKDGQG